MDDRTPPLPPDLRNASALPAEHYLGTERLAFDLEHILAPGWQVIAPASAVRDPGDHIVREIAGKPVLIVRNGEGRLNGFFNICRHRAGPLATCDGKGAKRLRCAYHGWIYNLDGELRVAPEMQEAKGFTRDGIALYPVEVREWRGLVFARAGSKGPDFDAVIGPLDRRIAEAGLEAMVHHHAHVYEVACNWKVYVDNYLESYHVPSVHPALNSLLDCTTYEVTLDDWTSIQRSPVGDDTGPYAAGDALYVFVWPNTMLNILPGRLQTNRVVPDGPDRCKVEFDFYYAPGVEARAEADDVFSAEVQEEDRMICEQVQRALASGVYTPGRLSPTQEAALWHFQERVRTAHATMGPQAVF